MNTKIQGLRRSAVVVNQVVANFNQARRMSFKGLVGSPYWRKGYNPNYPEGCSRSVSEKIVMRNNPEMKKIVLGSNRVKILSSGNFITESKEKHRAELKEAKAKVVNKKKMTTVFSTAF